MKRLAWLLAGALTASVVAQAGAAASPKEIRPLLIGSAVPSVSVRTVEGVEVDLAERTSKQRTVLVFYRGGW